MILILSFLLWNPVLASAQNTSVKKRVAVMQLVNKATLSKSETGYLSDLLRESISLVLSSSFIMLDRENINVLLPRGKQVEDCEGSCAIETGRLLGVDYIVTGDLVKFGDEYRCVVRLHETQEGQLMGVERESATGLKQIEKGIQNASQRLISKILKPLSPQAQVQQKPSKHSRKASRKKLGKKRIPIMVEFKSTPRGAGVMVDQIQYCTEKQRKCRIPLTVGPHQVQMTRKGYKTRTEQVRVSRQTHRIHWKLTSNQLRLKVQSNPSALKVKLDQNVYITPFIKSIEVTQSYRLTLVDTQCYHPLKRTLTTKNGQSLDITLNPKALTTKLYVDLKDAQGLSIASDFSIDGQALGKTPQTVRVPVCSKRLKIKHPRYGTHQTSLTLKSNQKNKIILQVKEMTPPHTQKNSNSNASSTSSLQWATYIGGASLILIGIAQMYSASEEASNLFPSKVNFSSSNSTSIYDEYDSLSTQHNIGIGLTTIGTLLLPLGKWYLGSSSSSFKKSSFSSSSILKQANHPLVLWIQE